MKCVSFRLQFACVCFQSQWNRCSAQAGATASDAKRGPREPRAIVEAGDMGVDPIEIKLVIRWRPSLLG